MRKIQNKNMKKAGKAYSKDVRNAVEECASVPVCVQLHINNGIPWSTLLDHVSRKYEQVGKGGPTVLTSIEEREIALTCDIRRHGFCLTKDLVEVVLFEYIKEQQIPNPFHNGIPGRDWWTFLETLALLE